MRCAARCGALVAEQLGHSPGDGMRDALRFLTRQARTRVCALGPEQARQEALAIASVRSQMGISGAASLTARDASASLVTEAARSEPEVASLTPVPAAVAVRGRDV
jgi:glycerol-3-phosphate dehydrogenase